MSRTHKTAAFLLLLLVALRPHLSGAAYPFIQGLLLVPVLVGLAVLVLMGLFQRSDGVFRIPLLMPWVLFSWALATLAWAPDPGQGVRDCAALFLNVSAFTLAFALFARGAGEGRYRHLFLGAVVLPVLVRALHQRYFGLARLRETLKGMEGAGQNVTDLLGVISHDRVFAGFLNSNMLAGFLCIVIPATLDMALGSKEKAPRIGTVLLLAVETWVLLLTGSLGGTIVAVLAVMAVLALHAGIGRGRILWAGLAGMAVVVLLIAVRGVDFLTGPESSIAQRWGYVTAGARMASVKPFLGWGAGSSPGALMGFVPVALRPVADPHNFLARVWLEWGIPGLAVLLGFLFSWTRSISADVLAGRRQGRTSGMAGLVAGSGAFILHSLVDMDFYVPEVSMFGWVAMGAALGAGRFGRDDEPQDAGGAVTKLKLAVGGLLLAAVLPVLAYFQGEMTAFRADREQREGNLAAAAELFRSAGEILAYNGRFALEEGRIRQSLGQARAANELFLKADLLMAASPYPRWELGRAAQSSGLWEESLPYLETALERYPTSPRIRIDIALAYLNIGKREEASLLLEEARGQSVFDGEARAFADEVLRRMGHR